MDDRFLAIVCYRYLMSSLFQEASSQTLVDGVVFRQQYVQRMMLSDAPILRGRGGIRVSLLRSPIE
jgi:hypothetical protein